MYSVIYGLPKKEEEQLQYTPFLPCWAQYSVPFVELGKYSLYLNIQTHINVINFKDIGTSDMEMGGVFMNSF